MNDVQFNAAALARHRESVERYSRQHAVVAAEQPAFEPVQPIVAADEAPAAAPEPSVPVAAAAPAPNLSESQMARLEQNWMAPAPAETQAGTPLETKAKDAAAKVVLSARQSALLAQSLGLAGTAIVPQRLADAGIPVARQASAVPVAKAVDPALSPDQMALLMASFGVSGQPAAAPEESEPAQPPAASMATLPKPADASTEGRFFPTMPRSDAGATALASDAYLKTVQTMERSMGHYVR